MAKVLQFVRECRAEFRKVVWPSRSDVVLSVKVVVMLIVLTAVVLGLFDWGFTEIFRALMQ